MRSSNEARRIIKLAESLKLVAYLCPAGVWTIGWGHTRNVHQGQTFTVAEAEKFLSMDIAVVEMALNQLFCTINLTQGQFDALTSFVFNVKLSEFRVSTMYRMLMADSSNPAIALQFGRWKFGGDGSHNGRDDDGDGSVDEAGEKQSLAGLLTRRQMEAVLFQKK